MNFIEYGYLFYYIVMLVLGIYIGLDVEYDPEKKILYKVHKLPAFIWFIIMDIGVLFFTLAISIISLPGAQLFELITGGNPSPNKYSKDFLKYDPGFTLAYFSGLLGIGTLIFFVGWIIGDKIVMRFKVRSIVFTGVNNIIQELYTIAKTKPILRKKEEIGYIYIPKQVWKEIMVGSDGEKEEY